MKVAVGRNVTNCKISFILTRKIVQRFICCAVTATVFCGITPGAVYADESSDDSKLSIFGVDMQDAYGRHFFSHFRFRPIGLSVTSDGFTEMLLRLPRSSRFRPFVNVYVALDGEGKIMRARIHLRRRFIEDKVQGAFARDIAKTFVQAAVPEDEFEKVRPITNEIFFRQEITRVPDIKVETDDKDKKKEETSAPTTIFKLGSGKLREGDIIIMGEGGELPELPKKTSDLYKAFIGTNKVSRLALNDSVLKFSNQKLDGEETLVISIGSKADQAGDKNHSELDYGNMPMHIPGVQ